MENRVNQVIIQNKLSALKCSVCMNVLSIPPIKVLSADGKVLQCGRCIAIRKNVVSRDYAYEKIAELLSFPCIYDGCQEMIPWAGVQEHEKHCTEKVVLCPINSVACKTIKVKNLEEHCLTEHPDNIFYDSLTSICSTRNYIFAPSVLIFKKKIFFILLGRSHWQQYTQNHYYHQTDQYEFCCYVTSLSDDTKFTYTLKLSSVYNNSLFFSFEKQKITEYVESEQCFTCIMRGCSLGHHPNSTVNRYNESTAEWCKKINLSATETLFGNIAEIKIEIEIVDSEDQMKETESQASQANHLRDSLQCPICMEYMIASIFSCARGHVLCHKCRNKMHSCPSCRVNLDNLRNYPLENLAAVLVLNCTNSLRGCKFSGLVRRLFKHEKVCDYKEE